MKNSKRVGFVVDTQHTFASGYDWVNDMAGVVDELGRVVGIENVSLYTLMTQWWSVVVIRIDMLI